MELKVDESLASLFEQAKGELRDLLKSEVETLAKSANYLENAEASPEEPPKEAIPEESSPEPEVSQEPQESPEAPVPAEGTESPEQPAEQGEIDPEALKAEYASLSKEDLQVHFLAIKAAMEASMGAEAQPEVHAPAPVAEPVGSPPPAQPTLKSESEIKISELENKVELLAKALKETLEVPMQKAIVSTEGMQKPVPVKLSKSEVMDKLKKSVSEKALSRKDMDRVIGFTLGMVSEEEIKDLI